ncbi:hypothetical protein NC652_040391 [Populus alba x Populus x berolinensis]|nr:hypothetical protein NC652_040391 [Populus alba x Populus x berolinensis]
MATSASENCRDPNVRFLVADWERLPGFGIGAQLAGMCGLLAIAINEKRVLVTSYYNRADHDGCKECVRWFEALEITADNTLKKTMAWGELWRFLQPTTEINGSLVAFHRKMDRRWWRAQAYTILDEIPNSVYVWLDEYCPKCCFWEGSREDGSYESPNRMGQRIFRSAGQTLKNSYWSSHRPWIPRPLLSMHVRMGDKACEMKVVAFEGTCILLTGSDRIFLTSRLFGCQTEMQEVVDKSKQYTKWDFYYTNRPTFSSEHWVRHGAILIDESCMDYLSKIKFLQAAAFLGHACLQCCLGSNGNGIHNGSERLLTLRHGSDSGDAESSAQNCFFHTIPLQWP